MRITSFLYVLLRPLDETELYRMERDTHLPKRVEIACYILMNRIENPEKLKAFTGEDLAFDKDRSTGNHS